MSGKVVFGVVLVASTAAAVYWPRLLVGAGPLVAGHAELAKDCWACHSPLRGVPDAKCAGCHAPRHFVRDTEPRSQALSRFHERLGSTRCVRCHREHLGADAEVIFFDHSLLATGDANQCEACHGADAPQDALHQGPPAPCGQCHETRAWRPAHFDHERFFRLDREHSERGCIGCHQAEGRYQTYQCLGCHEHRADHLEREHREEGVAGYSERCAECHTSPNEHDVKSGTRAKSGKGHEREHEEHDGERSKRRKRHDEREHDDDD